MLVAAPPVCAAVGVGLGCRTADLQIHWSSDAIERVANVPADRLVMVKEGDGIVKTVTFLLNAARHEPHCRLPDELIDVISSEPYLDVMAPAHVDLREYVFEPGIPILLIDVVHASGDVEERDHLIGGIDDQGVSFARRFEDVITGLRCPVMLEIMPTAFDHVPVNRGGMPVPAEEPSPSHAQQVAPLSCERVQHQWAKPDVFCLGHPHALIFRDGAYLELLR